MKKELRYDIEKELMQDRKKEFIEHIIKNMQLPDWIQL